jgi:hypothetical protein
MTDELSDLPDLPDLTAGVNQYHSLLLRAANAPNGLRIRFKTPGEATSLAHRINRWRKRTLDAGLLSQELSAITVRKVGTVVTLENFASLDIEEF